MNWFKRKKTCKLEACTSKAKEYVLQNGFELFENHFLLTRKECFELFYEIAYRGMFNPLKENPEIYMTLVEASNGGENVIIKLAIEKLDLFIIPGTDIRIETYESITEKYGISSLDLISFLQTKQRLINIDAKQSNDNDIIPAIQTITLNNQ